MSGVETRVKEDCNEYTCSPYEAILCVAIATGLIKNRSEAHSLKDGKIRYGNEDLDLHNFEDVLKLLDYLVLDMEEFLSRIDFSDEDQIPPFLPLLDRGYFQTLRDNLEEIHSKGFSNTSYPLILNGTSIMIRLPRGDVRNIRAYVRNALDDMV